MFLSCFSPNNKKLVKEMLLFIVSTNFEIASYGLFACNQIIIFIIYFQFTSYQVMVIASFCLHIHDSLRGRDLSWPKYSSHDLLLCILYFVWGSFLTKSEAFHHAPVLRFPWQRGDWSLRRQPPQEPDHVRILTRKNGGLFQLFPILQRGHVSCTWAS